MKSVYLSSTFKDLHEHRAAVANALAKAGYHVIRMEDYRARDLHTKAACEGDVAQCQVYIGMFAWRYGYIPGEDNPEQKSITELEYDAAKHAKRLIFLLKEDTDWPAEMRDADDTRIVEMRTRLKTRSSAYFKDREELTTEVLAALLYDELAKPIDKLSAVETFDLGPSHIDNLREKIALMKAATLLNIHVGKIPWWNTRLHLVASLLMDFTNVKELIFCDDNKRFLAMATPPDVRLRLAERAPVLEDAYLQFKQLLGTAPSSQQMDLALLAYPSIVSACFGKKQEFEIKEDVESDLIYKGLGLKPEATSVQLSGQPPTVLQYDIIRCSTPYVVLECGGTCDSVIDRVAMATRMAENLLLPRL